MGLGLIGAYGVAGAQDSLEKILAERVAAKKYADLQRQQAFENQQRLEDAAQRRTYQDASLASLAEQRAANADLRRQNSAAKLSEDLNPGDVLDPGQADLLNAASRGSLMDRRAATLPSRSSVGFLRTAPSADANGGPLFTGGVLRTTNNPGNPAQTVYRGTATQRKLREQQERLRQFVEGLPPNSPERKALEYQLHTGDNPPAGMFQRELTPSFQLQPIYDESGRPSGAVRFNQRTGAVEPVELPGAGIRAGAGRRDGLPVRVQNYLLQLRTQHPRFEDAQAELSRVLANAPDETFDRLGAATALRQLYAQPTGQGSELDQLLRGGGGASGSQFLGEAPATGRDVSPAGVAQGGGTITRAELRAVAQRLGITEQQAAQQAHARGMQVQ